METTVERAKEMMKGEPKEPKEGKMTKRVEQMTAQVPSMAYLGLAASSMILSASIAAFTRKKNAATFVGLWVPTLLLIGVYNKLVKLHPNEDAA